MNVSTVIRKLINQFKNGKWCCSKNMNGCPQIRRQRKQSSKKLWNEVKNNGLKKLNQLPKNNIIQFQQGICSYCGKEAKHQLKNGKWCCQSSPNKCPVNREKNKAGVLNAYQNGLEERKVFTEDSRWRQGKGNRGKTKFTDQKLKERGERLHQKYLNGQIKPSWQGRIHTEEQIDKIFHGMTNFRAGVILKGFKHGWYKNYWCDSSWQLAFIIYNLQHNIKFQRNEKGFWYTFENKRKRFYPDFIMQDGSYLQIKGYHSDMTDAKVLQFPKQQKLIILYKEDMIKYFEYVIEKYGQQFWYLLQENPF